jgi:hypothetical protein
MIQIKLKDKRLSKRWEYIVRSHMKVASPLAAGGGGLGHASVQQSFAATQAVWRFFSNERITFEELIVPLRDFTRLQCGSIQAPFLLVAHDWSKLSYPGHKSRKDMPELSNSNDIGYELTCALAINPDNGAPIAPLEMHFKTAAGTLSTRENVETLGHIDQVLPTMDASAHWKLGKPIVHVIDREADSVGHYRQWDASSHKFLIRADDRRVLYQGQRVKLSDVRNQVRSQGGYQAAGPVLYHNRKAELEIAEVDVILYRPARKSVNKVRTDVPGVPLPVRMVLTRVVDGDQKLLAEWYLLSNVPRELADTKLLAHCYYWRWKIETFFKLSKSHGAQIEDWQQETAAALFRRLLVASMATATVWHLLASDDPKTNEFKTILMGLSRRQTKRKRPFIR